jgi:hypothetical protein
MIERPADEVPDRTWCVSEADIFRDLSVFQRQDRRPHHRDPGPPPDRPRTAPVRQRLQARAPADGDHTEHAGHPHPIRPPAACAQAQQLAALAGTSRETTTPDPMGGEACASGQGACGTEG